MKDSLSAFLRLTINTHCDSEHHKHKISKQKLVFKPASGGPKPSCLDTYTHSNYMYVSNGDGKRMLTLFMSLCRMSPWSKLQQKLYKSFCIVVLSCAKSR